MRGETHIIGLGIPQRPLWRSTTNPRRSPALFPGSEGISVDATGIRTPAFLMVSRTCVAMVGGTLIPTPGACFLATYIQGHSFLTVTWYRLEARVLCAEAISR